MRDLKYIIKRIIIGTGIALAVMFMKQNVLAYEWETEGDTNISTINYFMQNRAYINSSSGSNSYPTSISGDYINVQFYTSDESGTLRGSQLSYGGEVGPTYFTGFDLAINTLTFTPDNSYYIVIPFLYDPTMLTSINNNFNNQKIIDATTYTASSDKIIITSGNLSFGSDAPTADNNLTKMMYFKIYFDVTEDVSNVHFYINASSNSNTSTKRITYSAWNTTTFDDYLYKFNFTCSSYSDASSNSNCRRYSNRMLKPFVYTHIAGSIYPSGDDIVGGVSDDIKGQIDDIVDGVFVDDLDFPSMDGGGMHFGDNEYSLQDLLLMPLNFLQKLTTSDSCSPVSVPVPGLSASMNLPCISTFMGSIVGQQLVDIIKLIVGCILGFKIIISLYNYILRILSPDRLLPVDDIF